MRVELPIGQRAKLADISGWIITAQHHVVVVEGWGCDKCPLSSTKQCLENRFKCFSYQRSDNKNTHFEEVKDADRKI